MDPAILSLLISALVPSGLERLKRVPWAVFIQPYAPLLNRVTGLVVAVLTSIGVTVSFDAEAGVATIAGLQPWVMARLALTAAGNWAVQEVVYRTRIDRGGPR